MCEGCCLLQHRGATAEVAVFATQECIGWCCVHLVCWVCVPLCSLLGSEEVGMLQCVCGVCVCAGEGGALLHVA